MALQKEITNVVELENAEDIAELERGQLGKCRISLLDAELVSFDRLFFASNLMGVTGISKITTDRPSFSPDTLA